MDNVHELFFWLVLPCLVLLASAALAAMLCWRHSRVWPLQAAAWLLGAPPLVTLLILVCGTLFAADVATSDAPTAHYVVATWLGCVRKRPFYGAPQNARFLEQPGTARRATAIPCGNVLRLDTRKAKRRANTEMDDAALALFDKDFPAFARLLRSGEADIEEFLPSASDADIEELEGQLGVPPSYKRFLRIARGMTGMGGSLQMHEGHPFFHDFPTFL